jgi:hypothetical protein
LTLQHLQGKLGISGTEPFANLTLEITMDLFMGPLLIDTCKNNLAGLRQKNSYHKTACLPFIETWR